MIKERIGEKYVVDAEALQISSGAGATSQWYSMVGYSKALVVIGHSTVGPNLTAVVTINQSATSSAAGAAITASSMVIGSSAANRVSGAKTAFITITTATTDNETVVLNGTTFTNATAVSATGLVFGATAGATAAAGADTILLSLSSLINTYCTNLRASTVSTAVLMIEVKDAASTSITVVTTGGGMTVGYGKGQQAMEILPSALNSSSRGFRVNISTCGTGCAMGITVIREPADKPAVLHGAYSIATAVGT